ncbi:hypothetical protein EGT74_23750 [Chitinophaga lutea]|uniref:Glycosyltransferase RgtA/B/C/D-like domain-containing protein n=1 Tax=Chitinophaga lutea TaxID=2488634 RepID=A0A3N4P9S1_9BACT|nr:glycosyltransferase family 39 protein [Chitinophaga lutea]RPE05403.1 hypothetical protein EGT74_23750 [Chitinophaga lutea]
MSGSGFSTQLSHAKGIGNAIWAAVIIITALRLAFIWQMGLMPQDAYYHLYGEYPALSYFDHPSAIAWVLQAATSIFGKKVFAIKLADTVVTLGTLLVFYRLSLHVLSRAGSRNALLLLYSTLMVTILSLVSTPDTPLLLFWALSLLCLYRAIFLERKWYWLWTGIAMGLAFNSKYTALFLPFGMMLYLVLSRPHRPLLLSPWPWLSLCGFGVVSLPVVIWNVQHGFASFRFQSSARVSSGLQLNPLDVLGVIGHQAAILMPVLLFALVYFIYRMVRKYRWHIGRLPSPQLFLLCFFLPVFLGFFIISPVYWVKLNWMMPAYVSGIIWVAVWFREKYLRWQWICSLVVHLALAVEIIWYPVPVNSDDVWVGWDGLAVQAGTLERQYPGDFIFSADDYKTSAVLTFYLDSLVYSRNVLGMPALQFDYIREDVQALAGRNAIFINSVPDNTGFKDEQAFTEVLRRYFSTVSSLPPIVIRKGDRVLRTFLVYRCTDYRPPVKQKIPFQ